jgi:hypothetical protein
MVFISIIIIIIIIIIINNRARGSILVVAWSTTLQVGKSRVRFPVKSFNIFNWLNRSSRTMALWSTQPVTELSTRNLPGGKGRPARKADNLTAISEPIV